MRVGYSSFTAVLAAIALLVVGTQACRRPPPAWHEPLSGIELLWVPSGSFDMGSPATEFGREVQEVQHRVRLTRGFYLGRHEVTQEEWRRVMGDSPSAQADCDRCPMESLNYFQIAEFLERLKAHHPGEVFRLPTEAEWEYAARAGTSTPFATGRRLSTDQANYDGRYPYADGPAGIYRGRTTPVGSFAANSWGFYDMHGNVWEWCADWHCPYPAGSVDDPFGECDSGLKVIRGGSWYFNGDSARSAVRYTHAPQDLGPSLGFRLLREAPPSRVTKP